MGLGIYSGTAWSQARGGDVYASATLQSFVPDSYVFIMNGTGGYPGVATYGTAYDFDSDSVKKGENKVSTGKNWLVNDTAPATNFYQLMFSQFGGTPATIDYVNPASPVSQPAARATPY